ncbi:MAG: DinB family protein [Acidimicrobiia bacterium]|nr:DinB family protein [Acidimicrobiia bacterium]
MSAELIALGRYLDSYRGAARWKLEGLDEEQARHVAVPSGTNLLSVLKHLGYVERFWFQEVAAQGKPTYPSSDDDPDAEFRLEPGDTVASVTAFHTAECDKSREILAGFDSGETLVPFSSGELTIRDLALHMLEEIARHVGHMDIIREQVDGATGGFPRGGAPWEI